MRCWPQGERWANTRRAGWAQLKERSVGRQPLVPGERICMPELFVNCKALSPDEELFLAGNLSCKRLFRLFRELALGTSDFGAQFVGCFFSAWVFSFVCSLTFVELCMGPWGFSHRLMGPTLEDRQGHTVGDFLGVLWKPQVKRVTMTYRSSGGP